MIVLNKKIKAFTISELLVTLVISSLVIGLSMLILGLINKQLGIIHKNTSTATEVQLLEKVLWQDFNRYNLYYDTKRRQLHGLSEIDTVTYQLGDTYVVRNLDTLEIPVFNVTSYLDGNLATNSDIDALELQLSKKSTAPKIFIYKTKDATFYMNSNGF